MADLFGENEPKAVPKIVKSQDIKQLPLVTSQIEKAVTWIAKQARLGIADELEIAVLEYGLQSPIEAVFWIWWDASTRIDVAQVVDLNPQRSIESQGHSYRADFVVQPVDVDDWFDGEHAYGLKFPQIAVELDGHDWHEKTRAQVARRNRRDRHLQIDGWKVFHFSGSEVVRDPHACVSEVKDFAEMAWWRFAATLRRKRLAEKRALDVSGGK